MSALGAACVFVGGGLGACLRWLFSLALNPLFHIVPLGTLAVNLIGGYLVGIAAGFFAHRHDLPAELSTEIIDAGGLPVERMSPGTALWQSTESCARQRAFTASDSVGLMLGIGERWRIWIGDDGQLAGELIAEW